MKPLHVVEAALFSAGRALSVQEIVERTGLPEKDILQAIGALAKLYAERDTVLEVGKAGTKWAMQVRAQAAEPAAKFAQMEIAPKLLKTLALIAYHQPMKQSELVEMIGTKVYDHIPELKELGLVRTRQDGATKILSTTPRFPEYFGLDAADPEQIRQVMGRLVGVEAPKRRKEKGIESFAAGDHGGPGVQPAGDQEDPSAEAARPTTQEGDEGRDHQDAEVDGRERAPEGERSAESALAAAIVED